MEEFGIVIYSVGDVIYSYKSANYALKNIIKKIKQKHHTENSYSEILILSYKYQTSLNKMMGKIIDENNMHLLKVEEDESEGYYEVNIGNEERVKFAVI